MPRSIFEVEVKDEKFKAFLSLFQDYQDQLKGMESLWSDASKAAEGTTTATGSMVDALAAGAASTALIVDAMGTTEGSVSRATATMGKMAEHAKSVAGSIMHATWELAKWSTLSLGAGLIGGGAGLFGLDALANAVSGQRKSAQGLGVTTGEQQAFGTNFGSRLVGSDFLSSVQGIKSDLAQQWMFSQLGIPTKEVQQADTATLGIDVIRRAQQLWQQAGPSGHNKQWMDAHGLGGFMDFATWQRIGQASSGDINQYESQYQRDVGTMGASDRTQRAWQDFSIQMKRAGDQIESVFVKGLVPLTGPLSRLSASVEHALAGFLGNPHLREWIDSFGHAIDQFGTYLGSDKFSQDIKDFVDDIAYAAGRIKGVLQYLGILPGDDSITPPPGQHAPGTPEYSTGHAARGPSGTPIPPPLGAPDADVQLYERNLQQWRSTRPDWHSTPPLVDPGAGSGWGRYLLSSANAASLGAGGVGFGGLEQSYGLPHGILYNVWGAESDHSNAPDTFRENSHHAMGPFQFTPNAAREYGVTDRNDLGQSSAGAAHYLYDMLRKYRGDVAKALAAYNWGPDNVDRDVAAHADAWQRFAPKETRDYISKIQRGMNVTITVMNQTGAQVAMLANAVRV
jgi:hypothetical protein